MQMTRTHVAESEAGMQHTVTAAIITQACHLRAECSRAETLPVTWHAAGIAFSAEPVSASDLRARCTAAQALPLGGTRRLLRLSAPGTPLDGLQYTMRRVREEETEEEEEPSMKVFDLRQKLSLGERISGRIEAYCTLDTQIVVRHRCAIAATGWCCWNRRGQPPVSLLLMQPPSDRNISVSLSCAAAQL